MQISELKAYLKSLPILADKENSNKRKAKALKSFESFARIYFPHHINFNKKETSKFRNFIYKNITTLMNKHPILLFESYRGSAKTTIITRLLCLYSLICLDRKYSIIISSTASIAKESLETIKTELEDNSLLKSDFNITEGWLWSSEEVVFKVGEQAKKIKVFGAGKKIRGTNFLSSRPDVIFLDDIENDENIQSKAQRDKDYSWFFKAILKLPSFINKNVNIIIVGTRLHHDGLIARLSEIYQSYKFQLITKFPPFFDEITKQNYKEFDYLAMELDDSQADKLKVIETFLDNKESFYSEYQNEPLSLDGAIFSGYETFEVFPECSNYYIGIDPALGKAKGDYFAITLLGQKDNFFYASSFGYKLKPADMIEKIIALYLKYINFYPTIAIETIAFQEFFKDALKKEALKKGINLRVKELKNSVAKELRLDSLSPYLADKTIKVHVSSHLLIEELETYPKARHDDLLDSLEMAFRIASVAGIADYRAINRLLKKSAPKFEATRTKL